jgi:hypothetical protein
LHAAPAVHAIEHLPSMHACCSEQSASLTQPHARAMQRDPSALPAQSTQELPSGPHAESSAPARQRNRAAAAIAARSSWAACAAAGGMKHCIRPAMSVASSTQVLPTTALHLPPRCTRSVRGHPPGAHCRTWRDGRLTKRRRRSVNGANVRMPRGNARRKRGPAKLALVAQGSCG